MADLLLRVIHKFGLSDRVATATTDSGSEIPVALRLVRQSLNDDRDVHITSDWHIRKVYPREPCTALEVQGSSER